MKTAMGIDVSNYTSPLTPEQLAWVEANCAFVIIGLQDAGRARDFQRQFANLQRMYYVERPNRDLSIPEPGAMVWLDVEPGCLVTQGEFQQALSACEARSLPVGVYGNQTSIQPVFGGMDLSRFPYWWANYGTPDLSRFTPHNGWTKPTIMQYSSDGVQGINCDLNIMEVADVATEHYENELNDRRARDLLNYHLQNTLQLKATWANGQLALVDRNGQPVALNVDVPDWAAPN